MIALHSASGQLLEAKPDSQAEALPPGTAWIDLVRPEEAEIAFVERLTGIELPTLAQLSEVEASSRLRREKDALILAMPLVFRDEHNLARITPVGIIISADRLVTIRYEDIKAFATCRERIERHDGPEPAASGMFVALLEAIVDRLADLLEEVGAELDSLAELIFGSQLDKKPTRRPKHQNVRLRRIMRRIGLARQLASKVRATLLAIVRIVPYVESEAESWLPPEARNRLDWIRQDVASLDEYEVHLSDKVQFLLDADLGLINIEQNDLFRILTIVSVVGILPTFVSSMYGMNFKHMPELDWTYGYAYGLALIALSTILPIVWFRLKGWF